MNDDEYDETYPIEWHYWKPCPACSMPIRTDQKMCEECVESEEREDSRK